jgi:hypothetical protein
MKTFLLSLLLLLLFYSQCSTCYEFGLRFYPTYQPTETPSETPSNIPTFRPTAVPFNINLGSTKHTLPPIAQRQITHPSVFIRALLTLDGVDSDLLTSTDKQALVQAINRMLHNGRQEEEDGQTTLVAAVGSHSRVGVEKNSQNSQNSQTNSDNNRLRRRREVVPSSGSASSSPQTMFDLQLQQHLQENQTPEQVFSDLSSTLIQSFIDGSFLTTLASLEQELGGSGFPKNQTSIAAYNITSAGSAFPYGESINSGFTSLSLGAIIGIAVGGFFLVVFLVMLGYYYQEELYSCCCRCSCCSGEEDDQQNNHYSASVRRTKSRPGSRPGGQSVGMGGLTHITNLNNSTSLYSNMSDNYPNYNANFIPPTSINMLPSSKKGGGGSTPAAGIGGKSGGKGGKGGKGGGKAGEVVERGEKSPDLPDEPINLSIHTIDND